MSSKQAASRAAVILAPTFFLISGLAQQAQSQAVPAIFGQKSQIDCSDEVNADNPACSTARSAPVSPQEAAPGVPPGAAQASAYNDTEQLYVDRSPDKFSLTGRPERQAGAPEPLTEFQKLVSASTQVVLPLYGASLFQADQPSTFAPANQISVTPDYVVGPGDEVLLRTWGQLTLNARLTVDRSGDIYVPRVGQVHVAGLPFAQLGPVLRSAAGRLYRNFDLNVNMGQLRSVQIFVTGYARRPGSYTISSLSTLLNAIFVSGGPAADGSMRRIELKREDRVVATFDLYELLLKGAKGNDAHLAPGDVIYYPPAGPQVAVAGSVRVPAIYELKPEAGATTVGELLAMAHGLSEAASTQHASIQRIDNREHLEDLDITLDAAGLAAVVRGGDLLHVLSLVPRFERTVTLRGNVANPGRYAWRPGMRIHDLIPNERILLTREYWEGKNALGAYSHDAVSSASPQEAAPDAATAQAAAGNNVALGSGEAVRPNPGDIAGTTALAESSTAKPGQLPVRNELTRSAADIDWRYAAIERLNPTDLTTNIVTFNLRKAVLDNDPEANLALEPGDVVTIFSTADVQVPQEQQVKFVHLDGEFTNAGVYQAKPGETLRQMVERVGGITGKAYLYGSVFTRESTREQQQQRLDEFANRLQRQVQLEGASLATSIPNATTLAATGTSQQSQQSLVASLRRLRATGRVVLPIPPSAADLSALPDLPLEDGDRFFVPATPLSVNVVGAVNDQNSFFFLSHRDLGKYLKAAGGPDRDGDLRHAFLIRADGSVVSRGAAWAGGFSRLQLYPGDTIVVPDNITRRTLLRGLTDWSQVFAQFALGAAAVNVVR